MLPPSRRRARRRSFNRRVYVLGGAALVTLLVIGGLTQVSRNSGRYTAQMNRSFAAQVTVLADASNVTASSVRHFIGTLSTQDRQTLQAELDGAVQQTAQQQTRAATMAAPAPPGQIALHFGTVFSDRAQAMSQMRAAVDGLLGGPPLAGAGAPTNNGAVWSPPPFPAPPQATHRIARAGALVPPTDRNYAAMR